MNWQKPNFVLSPCGTRLLTNGASPEERELLNHYSNAKRKEDTGSDAEMLQQILEHRKQNLSKADLNSVGKLSAELNAIVKMYGGNLSDGLRDHHVLLCTDIWLGGEAAEMAGEWMRSKRLNVEVRPQRDLQTADVASFQMALAEIVQWCEETLPLWHQTNYHIVFNLTGGFKSVQGFLQTLAMFYADESVYVFESSDALLRIPRLPIQISAEAMLDKFVTTFRRLAMELKVTEADVEGIPETMLMILDSKSSLSPWGEIVWRRSQKSLYEKVLHPSPSDKIVYGMGFPKSLAGLSGNRIREVNQKIDDLAKCLEQGDCLKSLDLKELKGNPKPGSTHELDAWSDQDAKRIFGHYDEQNRFVLDSLDKALH